VKPVNKGKEPQDQFIVEVNENRRNDDGESQKETERKKETSHKEIEKETRRKNSRKIRREKQ
jgi:hypothetical protein